MSKHVTDIQSVAEFNALIHQADAPVVVDFWAPWCGPCQSFGNILEKAAEQLADDATVVKVNVDDLPEIAREYRISSIPTVLYFAGGKLQHRESGIVQDKVIIERVSALAEVV